MKVLAVGAHPDDIELGCGASLSLHCRRGDEITMVVMNAGEAYPELGARRIFEQEAAADILGANLIWGDLNYGRLVDERALVSMLDGIVGKVEPDVVYVHAPLDTHQDHRATHQAVMSACRRQPRVLLFESPTSEGFAPSIFIPVPEESVEVKLRLLAAHASQTGFNSLVDPSAVAAALRYRGFQARTRHAEAFMTCRFVWDPCFPGDGF